MSDRYLDYCGNAGSRRELALKTWQFLQEMTGSKELNLYCLASQPQPALRFKADQSTTEDEGFKVDLEYFKKGDPVALKGEVIVFDVPAKNAHNVYALRFPRNLYEKHIAVLRTWRALAGMLFKAKNLHTQQSENYYGQLISQLMHDVQALVDLNAKDVDPEERQTRLDYQTRANKDLLFLLREFELYKSTVKIDTLLRDALSLLELEETPKIEGAQNCRLHVDVELFARAFNEIVKNAIEAGADARQLKIEYRISSERGIFSGKNYCTIEITDKAGGISVDFLPHIKKPFFTTKKYSGHPGLGLTIAERIIKEHGGSLEIESRDGCARVTLIIPVAAHENI